MIAPDVRLSWDRPEHWHVLAEWLLVGGVGVPVVLPDNLGIVAAKVLFGRSGVLATRPFRKYCGR